MINWFNQSVNICITAIGDIGIFKKLFSIAERRGTSIIIAEKTTFFISCEKMLRGISINPLIFPALFQDLPSRI
jgi:hypothetical protein